MKLSRRSMLLGLTAMSMVPSWVDPLDAMAAKWGLRRLPAVPPTFTITPSSSISLDNTVWAEKSAEMILADIDAMLKGAWMAESVVQPNYTIVSPQRWQAIQRQENVVERAMRAWRERWACNNLEWLRG